MNFYLIDYSTAEILEKIYFVFSKYDEQYLEEMEQEGIEMSPG